MIMDWKNRKKLLVTNALLIAALSSTGFFNEQAGWFSPAGLS